MSLRIIALGIALAIYSLIGAAAIVIHLQTCHYRREYIGGSFAIGDICE